MSQPDALAEEMKCRREALGLTRAEVSKLTGVPTRMIRAIETETTLRQAATAEMLRVYTEREVLMQVQTYPC